MAYRIVLAKERFKFASAHFTIFPATAQVERLHGHNYQVVVVLTGRGVDDGMLVPFTDVKRAIDAICKQWDEHVLLPNPDPQPDDHVEVTVQDGQVDVRVKLGSICKRYSFPEEDVVLLNCVNVTCECLAKIFCEQLEMRLADLPEWRRIDTIEVSINEGGGQTVAYQQKIHHDTR